MLLIIVMSIKVIKDQPQLVNKAVCDKYEVIHGIMFPLTQIGSILVVIRC